MALFAEPPFNGLNTLPQVALRLGDHGVNARQQPGRPLSVILMGWRHHNRTGPGPGIFKGAVQHQLGSLKGRLCSDISGQALLSLIKRRTFAKYD
jgi:hypothetical protein